MIFYTNGRAKFAARGVRLTYKSPAAKARQVDAVDGEYSFDTGETPGLFFYQEEDADGVIIAGGEFEVRQDLAHAQDGYDPRSLAEITLEALEAKIAGRALTIQQSKITVGDKSIDYMNSIDELLKWRDYFKREVAREKGRCEPRSQVCVLKRGV